MANINIQKKTTLSSSISLQHEPLFLNPDGVRVRYPIGWNGYGRYVKGSLRVLNNTTGKQEEITEEDNGIFFSFKSVPSKGSYDDYTVFYNVREDDYKFSTGASGSTYEGEEYFLFPNWLEAIGEKEAFWIGKYEASRTDANGLTTEGSSTILQSKKLQLPMVNATIATFKTYASNKGDKFHIIRNREWSNIALWCLHHGIEVDGLETIKNNMDSIHYSSSRKLTGYGYNSYTHNNKSNGIWDLAGNIWELVEGLKIYNNLIYVYDETNSTWINTEEQFYSNVWDTTATASIKFILNKTSNNGYNLYNECIPTINTTDSVDISNIISKPIFGGTVNNSEFVVMRGSSYLHPYYDSLYTFDIDSGFGRANADVGSRLVKEM